MLPSLRCSISLLMLSSFLLSGIGCEPEMDSTSSQPQYLSGKLVVTGSSTVAPLLSEMARRFELENPQVRIDIQTGGSGKGINDVIQATADIGMASSNSGGGGGGGGRISGSSIGGSSLSLGTSVPPAS